MEGHMGEERARLHREQKISIEVNIRTERDS